LRCESDDGPGSGTLHFCDPWSIALTPGGHVLTFRNRESDSRLDALYCRRRGFARPASHIGPVVRQNVIDHCEAAGLENYGGGFVVEDRPSAAPAALPQSTVWRGSRERKAQASLSRSAWRRVAASRCLVR
jgi:hypothetical protein